MRNNCGSSDSHLLSSRGKEEERKVKEELLDSFALIRINPLLILSRMGVEYKSAKERVYDWTKDLKEEVYACNTIRVRAIVLISKKSQFQTKMAITVISKAQNWGWESFRIRSQHSNGIIGELIGHVNFALKINSNDCTFQFRLAWKLFRLHVPWLWNRNFVTNVIAWWGFGQFYHSHWYHVNVRI